MDKLRVLQFFMMAADQGSYAAVAKSSGASPSTISKAISRLEGELKIQLFYRNTRRLTLTQPGEVYLETVRRITRELGACEHELQEANDEPAGHLKISVPMSYGRLYIRPWMKVFHQRFPEISFDLSYSDQYVDMIEQGIDVCIRSGAVQDNRLVARKLSPIDFVTCASSDYLANFSHEPQGLKSDLLRGISSPSEFSKYMQPKYKWIQFRFGQTGKVMPVKYSHKGGIHDFQPEDCMIVDDGEAMAELCADGFGLTQMPHFIARNWLQSGAIQTLLPALQIEGFGVYALYPKRHFLPSRVRVFIDFLIAQLALIGENSEQTWAS